LAYLTQPGGLLSNLPYAISTADLQSASPEDTVSLSLAAIQAQEADGLFGVSPTGQSATGLPVVSDDASDTTILPGVSPADLSQATPQENAAINDQALLLQQSQALFDPPSATSTLFNLST
jgi:hypothetical protein